MPVLDLKSPSAPTMSARKQELRQQTDASASERRNWLARTRFFHDEDLRYLKFLIPEGARVLELGCGTGDVLAALKPSHGVGVDFSEGMIAQARRANPDLTFLVGDIEDAAFVRSLPGPFDVIVVIDTLGALDDCQAMLEHLLPLCLRETRLVIGHFSHLWYPALKCAEALGLNFVDWHCLRRSHATWLVQSGADPKSVQGQMRHSRISTTMDIYAQIVPAAQRQAVEKLADFACHTRVTQNGPLQ